MTILVQSQKGLQHVTCINHVASHVLFKISASPGYSGMAVPAIGQLKGSVMWSVALLASNNASISALSLSGVFITASQEVPLSHPWPSLCLHAGLGVLPHKVLSLPHNLLHKP